MNAGLRKLVEEAEKIHINFMQRKDLHVAGGFGKFLDSLETDQQDKLLKLRLLLCLQGCARKNSGSQQEHEEYVREHAELVLFLRQNYETLHAGAKLVAQDKLNVLLDEKIIDLISNGSISVAEILQLHPTHLAGLQRESLYNVIRFRTIDSRVSLKQYKDIDPEIIGVLENETAVDIVLYDFYHNHMLNPWANIRRNFIPNTTKLAILRDKEVLEFFKKTQFDNGKYLQLSEAAAGALQDPWIREILSRKKFKTLTIAQYLELSDEGIAALRAQPDSLSSTVPRGEQRGKIFFARYKRNQVALSAIVGQLIDTEWMSQEAYLTMDDAAQLFLQQEYAQEFIKQSKIKVKEYSKYREDVIKSLNDRDIRELILDKTIPIEKYVKMTPQAVEGLYYESIRKMITDKIIPLDLYANPKLDKPGSRVKSLLNVQLQEAMRAGKISVEDVFSSPPTVYDCIVDLLVSNTISIKDYRECNDHARLIKGLGDINICNYIKKYPTLIKWYGGLSDTAMDMLQQHEYIRELLQPTANDDRSVMREQYARIGERCSKLDKGICKLIDRGIIPMSRMATLNDRHILMISRNAGDLLEGRISIDVLLAIPATPVRSNPFTRRQTTHTASINISTLESFKALAQYYGRNFSLLKPSIIAFDKILNDKSSLTKVDLTFNHRQRDCLPTVRNFLQVNGSESIDFGDNEAAYDVSIPAETRKGMVAPYIWHYHMPRDNKFKYTEELKIDFKFLLALITCEAAKGKDERRVRLTRDIIRSLSEVATNATMTVNEAAEKIVRDVYGPDVAREGTGQPVLDRAWIEQTLIAKRNVYAFGSIDMDRLLDGLNKAVMRRADKPGELQDMAKVVQKFISNSSDGKPAPYLQRFPVGAYILEQNIETYLSFLTIFGLVCRALSDKKMLTCNTTQNDKEVMPDDAVEALISSWYEIARGDNLINYTVDKDEDPNNNICFPGACNKFIQNMIGLHLLCNQIMVTKDTIATKYQHVLAEVIYKEIIADKTLKQKLYDTLTDEVCESMMAYRKDVRNASLLDKRMKTFKYLNLFDTSKDVASRKHGPVYDIVEEVKRKELKPSLSQQIESELKAYYSDQLSYKVEHGEHVEQIIGYNVEQIDDASLTEDNIEMFCRLVSQERKKQVSSEHSSSAASDSSDDATTTDPHAIARHRRRSLQFTSDNTDSNDMEVDEEQPRAMQSGTNPKKRTRE